MARKDALLLLHQRLIAKRDALRKKLSQDLQLTRTAGSEGGDVGDAAHDGAQNELDSQLASLESRELVQIEKALLLMRQGRYGLCELCEKPIPIERLKALPFTPYCVGCQRRVEESGRMGSDFDADWESAYEFEGRLSDRELTLGDLDVE